MKKTLNWKAIFIAMAATFGGMMIVWLIGLGESAWSQWEPATSMPQPFNEQIEWNFFIRQPWNTISSLAYVFAGAYVWALPFTEKKLGSTELSIMSSKTLRAIFSLSLIITGMGSCFLHQTLTFIGQTTDVVGMYLLSVFIILYALRKLPKLDLKLFCIIYVVANVILLLTLIFIPDTRRYLFAIFLVAALLLEHFFNRKSPAYTANTILKAASLMLIGFFLWWLDDSSRFFFSQVGFWQGHVFWHIFGSLAGAALFFHYKGEEDRMTALELDAAKCDCGCGCAVESVSEEDAAATDAATEEAAIVDEASVESAVQE